MSYALAAFAGALAMAIMAWAWHHDWSVPEVDTDFLTDPAMEDEL